MRLITLSTFFYSTYFGCSEILEKETRPYVCLEVEIDGVLFAIPFRHHISHRWAYFTGEDCGIDYSKAIVISDSRFIGPFSPQIDQAEFNAIKGKDTLIQNGMRKFLKAYRNAVKYPENPHYRLIRKCSSLQYFHKELHI